MIRVSSLSDRGDACDQRTFRETDFLEESPICPIKYYHGAVASEVPQCSTIGKEILQANGSAVDATIATLLCVGVINSFSSGIGGGGFMLVRPRHGSVDVIDFREVAPAAASEDMYNGCPEDSYYGGRSVAVPGEMMGFHVAHQKYGRLQWSTLFRPSIKLCREGFCVTPELAYRIKKFEPLILTDPVLSKVYAKNGHVLKEGDLLLRHHLANTLETIARKGVFEFYHGSLAQKMVMEIQHRHGMITLEDFRNYKAVLRKPVEGSYHGWKIISAPAPASGAVFIEALNILEKYSLSQKGETPLNIHRFIEVLKHAYASRMCLGDPDSDFMNTKNITEFEAKMLNKDFADFLRASISDDHTYPWQHYLNASEASPARDHGTAHVAVIDKEDMAVSTTSSVYLIMAWAL